MALNKVNLMRQPRATLTALDALVEDASTRKTFVSQVSATNSSNKVKAAFKKPGGGRLVQSQ